MSQDQTLSAADVWLAPLAALDRQEKLRRIEMALGQAGCCAIRLLECLNKETSARQFDAICELDGIRTACDDTRNLVYVGARPPASEAILNSLDRLWEVAALLGEADSTTEHERLWARRELEAIECNFSEFQNRVLNKAISLIGENHDDDLPQPTKPSRAQNRDVQSRMELAFVKQPESLGWTITQWCAELRCSRAAVQKTSAWKNLHAQHQVARANAEMARNPDRGRRRKPR